MKNDGYFSTARNAAAKAITQPYLVTIGGGDQVTPDLRGRVIEVVRVTGVYGETLAFVRDPDLRKRLSQWPVAVVLLEVYSVIGEPLLIDDLGFPDRRILTNAYDGVKSDPDDLSKLWNALSTRNLEFRRDILPLPGFRDPGKIRQCGTLYPTLKASATEGKSVFAESRRVERDASLARSAKDRNRHQNGGQIACEVCELTDNDGSLFDVHHLRPLAVGIRETLLDHLAVLCPTCHRWAHVKASDPLQPLPMEALQKAWARGREQTRHIAAPAESPPLRVCRTGERQ